MYDSRFASGSSSANILNQVARCDCCGVFPPAAAPAAPPAAPLLVAACFAAAPAPPFAACCPEGAGCVLDCGPDAGWMGVALVAAAGAGRGCSESVASSVCTLVEPDVDEPMIAELEEAAVVVAVVDGMRGVLILESESPSSSESDESSAEPEPEAAGALGPWAVIAVASARKSMGASSPAARVLAASPEAAGCCSGDLAAPFLDCACVGVKRDLAFEADGGDEVEACGCCADDLDEPGASACALVYSDHESSLSVDVPRFPASPPPAAVLSAFADLPSNFNQSESNRPVTKIINLYLQTSSQNTNCNYLKIKY